MMTTKKVKLLNLRDDGDDNNVNSLNIESKRRFRGKSVHVIRRRGKGLALYSFFLLLLCNFLLQKLFSEFHINRKNLRYCLASLHDFVEPAGKN